MNWARLCEQFGLLGVVVGAVIGLLFFIVKWTLSTTKEILNQSRTDRESWLTTVDRIRQSIEDHDKRAEERGRYVREEHKQMIEKLGHMNGYKR